MILKCKDPKDREAMVVILAKNGYTVRLGSKKLRPEDKQKTGYVEVMDDVPDSL